MDERSALAQTLQDKRERLNQQAHQERDRRDRMNDETKRHAQRRDELNAQVRALIDAANQHRSRRDEFNAKVREAKARRDELNREAHDKAEALAALRKERGAPDGSTSVAKLRAELRHLEYQQQTTALSPKKEKDLIDLIASKVKEIKERESAMQESADLREAYEAMKTAKAAAEEQHALVTQLANEAQNEHEQMVRLFGEADGLRKQADAAQADFVRSKVGADGVHRDYIEAVTTIRDIERVLNAMRGPGGSRERGGVSAADKAEAEDIFDKFRKGEKLSTEDLMTLQKAGRL